MRSRSRSLAAASPSTPSLRGGSTRRRRRAAERRRRRRQTPVGRSGRAARGRRPAIAFARIRGRVVRDGGTMLVVDGGNCGRRGRATVAARATGCDVATGIVHHGDVVAVGAAYEPRPARLPHPPRREDRVDDRDGRVGDGAGAAARPTSIRRCPATSYTIGFPAAFDFPEVLVFGLTPVATRGLFDLRRRPAARRHGGADRRRAGRAVRQRPAVRVRPGRRGRSGASSSQVGTSWHRGADRSPLVQLLWPDRNGFLPTEPGFDRRVVARRNRSSAGSYEPG